MTAQTKNQLLQAICKETKPPRRFGQWVLIIEHRRASDAIGLVLVETQLDGQTEWSGSVSVNLPERKKLAPNGQEIPSDSNNLVPGRSIYNVLTFEIHGKSPVELVKQLIKRSIEEGTLQDYLPWGKDLVWQNAV